MKINFLNTIVSQQRWRRGVILLAFLLVLWLGLLSGAAQMKQKHITSLIFGDAAEGARVTVVSDAAVNDYEAFRRGDRFYVKIPLAEFTAAQPGFRGDGFDDIQVQKIGDSVVISFKLQPGASARVDQRGSRLDVIFSSPIRLARSNGGNSSRQPSETSMLRVNSSSSQRNRDSAGPDPANSSSEYRQPAASGRTADGPIPTRRRSQVNSRDDLTPNASNRTATSPAVRSNSSTTVTPVASPNYPATTYTTPAPVASQPAASSSASSNKSGVSAWISTNRLATLIGVLLLLGLAAYLAMMINRRRVAAAKAKRAKLPRVQPRYTPDLHLDEKLEEPVRTSDLEPAIEFINNYKFTPTSTEATIPTYQDKVEPAVAPELAPANSFAAAASQNNTWLTRPSIGPATTGHDESITEDQDREVFEL